MFGLDMSVSCIKFVLVLGYLLCHCLKFNMPLHLNNSISPSNLLSIAVMSADSNFSLTELNETCSHSGSFLRLGPSL